MIKSLKEYRLIVWILLLLAALNLISIFFGFSVFDKNDPYVKLDVKPASNAILSKEAIKRFEGSELYFKGTLVIKDFSWWKRTILSKEATDACCFLILLVLVLLIIKTLQKKNDLHRKIGRYIFFAGLVFVFTTFINILQRYWLKTIVLEKTNGEFILAYSVHSLLPDSIIALILIIFSAIYTKAWQYKREQELTI